MSDAQIINHLHIKLNNNGVVNNKQLTT